MVQTLRVQNIERKRRHEYPRIVGHNVEDCLSRLRSDILSGYAFFFRACRKAEETP